MALSENAVGYIKDIFGYLSQGAITTDLKESMIDPILNLINGEGAPQIEMIYDETTDGWLPSFDGVTYGDGDVQNMLDAMNASSLVSDSVMYGSLGSTAETIEYGALHLAQLLAENTTRVPGSITQLGTASCLVNYPGCAAQLHIVESDGTNPPELFFICASTRIDVIPPIDVMQAASPTTDYSQYLYINYQILKSSDADAIFKCYLSTSPINPSGDYASEFEDISINNYNTSPTGWDDERPSVHPVRTSLQSGFALLQYDTVEKDEIELVGNYDYGVLFMNTNAAPLAYITDASRTPIYRTVTTSLHQLPNGREASAIDSNTSSGWVNEIMLAPISSETYNLETQAILAPIITPCSNGKKAMRSKWLCLGNSEAFSGVHNLSAFLNTYYVDHGLALSGGVSR